MPVSHKLKSHKRLEFTNPPHPGGSLLANTDIKDHIPKGCIVGNCVTYTILRYALQRYAWVNSDRSILRKKEGSHELLALTCTLLSFLYPQVCSDAELTRRSSGTWMRCLDSPVGIPMGGVSSLRLNSHHQNLST